MPDRPRSILVFGGTFDPPHLAHARQPPLVAAKLGCDRILYIPAALNPLKTDTPPTPAHHRVAMLRLALREEPHAEIDTQEIDRPGPSYTVDTLRALRRRLGEQVTLRLLLGADAAVTLDQWKDWRTILELAEPAVIPRPPLIGDRLASALRERFGAKAAGWWVARIVEVPHLDVNATEIRRRLESGADLSDLLDARVIDYIREHGLYGAATTRPTS